MLSVLQTWQSWVVGTVVDIQLYHAVVTVSVLYVLLAPNDCCRYREMTLHKQQHIAGLMAWLMNCSKYWKKVHPVCTDSDC